MSEQSIIVGDCIEVLKNFDDKFFDQFVTSPPYNLGIKYNTYKDSKTRNEYLLWIKDVFLIAKNKMKDNGSLFLNIGSSNKDPWIPYDIAQILRSDWVLQNNFVWVKSVSINDNTYGHFKPINSNRFVNHTFEHLFHFTKQGDVKIHRTSIGVPYTDKSNIKRWKSKKDLRCRGDVWYIPYRTIKNKNEKGGHPAIFPPKLVEWCIKLHGFSNTTVICDPFLGTGTTLMVTKQLGINGVGIEIDEVYAKYATTMIDKLII